MQTELFLNRFISFVEKNQLFSAKDKLLIATSGGIDSIVLCDLIREAGFQYAIAHMNFQLREEESDLDEQFVRELAEKNKAACYCSKVDCRSYAKQNGISIEMAARELRYQWFDELAKSNNFQFILTAHHKNDQTESILLNVTRGTAYQGFQGIKLKSGNIVRPLLFADREEIVQYAKERNLVFRFDKSNDDVDFKRNRIRKNVIPQLEIINPDIHDTVSRNAILFQKYSDFISHHLEQRIQKISRIIDNKLYIDFEQIQYDAYYELYLYEILRIYGFTSMQIKSITSSISMQTGKKFYSNTHVLRVNRDQFVISKSSSQNRLEITVNKEDEIVSIQDATMAFSVISHNEIDDIKNPYHAYLNFDEISFPLTIRNWRKGDRFIPYGNKGIKKLSDYFIDQKIESGEKNNIILLVSGDDIIWVAPHRIDERYKVSSNSNRILKVVLTRK